MKLFRSQTSLFYFFRRYKNSVLYCLVLSVCLFCFCRNTYFSFVFHFSVTSCHVYGNFFYLSLICEFIRLVKVWEESSGECLLQIQLLIALKNFVVALGYQSPLCYNILLPVLQKGIDINSPDELNLLEDSMMVCLYYYYPLLLRKMTKRPFQEGLRRSKKIKAWQTSLKILTSITARQ